MYYLNRQDNEKAKEAYLRKWIDAFKRATGIRLVFSKAKYDRAVALPDNAPIIEPLSIKSEVDGEDSSEEEEEDEEEEEEEEAMKTSKRYAAPGRKAKINKRAGRGSRKRDRSTSSSSVSSSTNMAESSKQKGNRVQGHRKKNRARLGK
jgi:hypothetical protein